MSEKNMSFWEMFLFLIGLYKPEEQEQEQEETPTPVDPPNDEEDEEDEEENEEISSSSSEDTSNSEEQEDEQDESESSGNLENNEEISHMKRALCIGINDYKGSGNDLNGCVNDAKNWAKLLKNRYHFDEVTIILDKEATRERVETEMRKLASISKVGDEVVNTYSGHGSNIPDRKPIDEADGRDETLYLYDGHLTDDVLRDVFNSYKKDVRVTFISDSCHSGTNTRAFYAEIQGDEVAKIPVPRYMPPEDDEIAKQINELPIRARIGAPEEDMNEILISGCLASEYSYDAYINGKPTGAMSYYAIQILKANPKITYNDFYTKLREKLPTGRYRQTPQLEGSAENKNSIMFE